MKNSIFKSYTKKILRSEAFISVIIVFVLALGIIGTSYALYMDVDKDTDYQLVEAGDLKISFSGSDTITLNMLPQEDAVATNLSDNIFTFNIYNTGTYNADYKIKLVATTGDNYVSSEHINYQLCKSACTDETPINTLNNIKDSIIHTDSIKTTDTGHDYILRVWVNNKYPGTTEQTLQVKVVVEANNRSETNLADIIMNDTRITKNSGTPEFTGVETNEVGMYSAEDDYGTSWYFRGKQSYNYVNFAGFTWRIVRINGDGSIRLILDGTLNKVIRKGDETPVYLNTNLSAVDPDGNVKFNSAGYANASDNAYVGYMYGTVTSTSYDEAHSNKKNSLIKEYIDIFYEEYIQDYSYILADEIFCADKTAASNSIGYAPSGKPFGGYESYYGSAERLYYSNGTTSITTATPTLECAKGTTNTYSRYTVNSNQTTKGVRVNNDLKYPIALLSGDELLMAGAWGGSGTTTNTSYYLYDAYEKELSNSIWWTMSPLQTRSNNAYVIAARMDGASIEKEDVDYGGEGVRPVINLKSTASFKTGNGTYETPYEIN